MFFALQKEKGKVPPAAEVQINTFSSEEMTENSCTTLLDYQGVYIYKHTVADVKSIRSDNGVYYKAGFRPKS